MRLLYVTATLPYGASEVFALPEIAALRARGHAVLVVPVRAKGELVHPEAGDVADPAALSGLGGPVLGQAFGRLRRPSSWSSLAALRKSPRSLAKNVAVYPKGLWVGRLAEEWGADHIHAYWASTPATVAMIAAHDAGLTWSFTAHRWDIYEDNLLAVKAADAAFVRFISDHGLSEATERGVVAGDRTPVIHMGVDVPSVAAPRPAGGPFTLLCPAGLIERKRHVTLLRALALLEERTPRLVLAGDGPLRPHLEDLVGRLGLAADVDFLGQVSHDDLMTWYRSGRVHATVLASRSEGIPVALIEAMGYGVPVIATLVSGVPELIRDGAGIGVPVDDPQALAAAIAELARDPSRAHRVGTAGRRRVEAEYAIDRITTDLEERFATAIG